MVRVHRYRPQGSDVTERVPQSFAQDGEQVAKGALLVRIQTPRTRSLLRQARSSREATRGERRQAEAVCRNSRPSTSGTRTSAGVASCLSTPSIRCERTPRPPAPSWPARAQARVAEEQVAEQAKVQTQTLVRAPITGRVGQRNVAAGIRVDPQTPLFVIGRLELSDRRSAVRRGTRHRAARSLERACAGRNVASSASRSAASVWPRRSTFRQRRAAPSVMRSAAIDHIAQRVHERADNDP